MCGSDFLRPPLPSSPPSPWDRLGMSVLSAVSRGPCDSELGPPNTTGGVSGWGVPTTPSDGDSSGTPVSRGPVHLQTSDTSGGVQYLDVSLCQVRVSGGPFRLRRGERSGHSSPSLNFTPTLVASPTPQGANEETPSQISTRARLRGRGRLVGSEWHRHLLRSRSFRRSIDVQRRCVRARSNGNAWRRFFHNRAAWATSSLARTTPRSL